MSTAGFLSLGLAFVAILLSIGMSAVGHMLTSAIRGSDEKANTQLRGTISRVSLFTYIAVICTTFLLTVGCGILVYGFISGDPSLEYVVKYHSNSTSSMRLLYEISGLWAGREGSLLFWTWLISLFAAVMAIKNLKTRENLDTAALAVVQTVLLAFVAVLLFSDNNMPFKALDPGYLNPDGTLMSYDEVLWAMMMTGNTALYPTMVMGMNVLLEHWAMAIHPPTLFIGYAGLTVPFAYAIAALMVNDPSKKWAVRSQRYTLFSWVFLGIGIGLGAIWAYVVLGWGGYWGWDPVENASLLPWVLAIALVHSLTLYRQRGIFKRWAVMCACLTFSFVIIATFITRSGVIQNSVHVFEGDPVSFFLFLSLIFLSVLAGFIGLIIRRKSFTAKVENEELSDSFFTRDVAYYFNNVVVIVGAFVLLYMTLSSAWPEWMPFGGESLPIRIYNLVARPITILYCFLMAVCPFLSWVKTDGKKFLKKQLVPAIGALVVFVILCVYFATYLMPSYYSVIARGDEFAQSIIAEGSPEFYFTLTIMGFFVASLLFFNALVMLGRLVRDHAKSTGTGLVVAFASAVRSKASKFGGFLSHLSISIILVGLIGSSMYVTEVTDYLPYDSETDTADGVFVIQDYHLIFTNSDFEVFGDMDSVFIYRNFDVYKNDRYVGTISPGVHNVYHSEYVQQQERKALAAVMSTPLMDLFVVYNGFTMFGDMSFTVKINPLISFVWVGFGLLMVGTTIATVGSRKAKSVKAGGDKRAKLTNDEDAGILSEAKDSKADCFQNDEPEPEVEAESEPEVESSQELKAKPKSKSTPKPKVKKSPSTSGSNPKNK